MGMQTRVYFLFLTCLLELLSERGEGDKGKDILRKRKEADGTGG